MYLICFMPEDGTNFVPQGLCYTEQQARYWVQNAPHSVLGTYVFMYVPVLEQGNFWQRREPWQLPGYVSPQVPYQVPGPSYVPEYLHIGDYPPGPSITC